MEYHVLKKLADQNVLRSGNIVYFTENREQVPYIYLQKGRGNNYLFLRKYANSDTSEFNDETRSQGVFVYEDQTLDRYLTGTFFNRFNDTWKRIFAGESVEVTNENNKLRSIQRKVFAPSAVELGIELNSSNAIPREGSTYNYFKTDSKEKRRLRVANENGDYVRYWTRSRNAIELFKYCAISIERDGDKSTEMSQKNKYHIRPVISITGDVTVESNGSMWSVVPNLPPVKPSSPYRIFTARSGSEQNFSWSSSTDTDGPGTVYYRVQQKIDSGEWTDYLTTSNTEFTKVIQYKEALTEIRYRVQAFDSYNNSSEWADLAQITVINNLPPETPGNVEISGKYVKESISIKWDEPADEDGNLEGYYIYRSVNGSGFERIKTTSSKIFTEIAQEGWDYVKYKIKAYDELKYESDFSSEVSLVLSKKITMSVSIDEDSDLKEDRVTSIGNEFESSLGNDGTVKIKFTIADTAEGEEYSASLLYKGNAISYLSNLEKNHSYSFEIEKKDWQTIMNGEHCFEISVFNSKEQTCRTIVSFIKNVTNLTVTLDPDHCPVVASGGVSQFSMNVYGSFPEGSNLQVKVTCNAKDESVNWQNVDISRLNTGEFIDFSATEAINGQAFNFEITAERGTATEPCYISSINGMFGRNIFEYILGRLNALEGGV